MYWDYHDDNFDWADTGERSLPDLAFTRQRLAELGLSSADVESFVHSGYVMIDRDLGRDIVIDRYYGGSLLSVDLRTRFPATRFLQCLAEGKNRVPVSTATSMTELVQCLDTWAAAHRMPLLFRGQTQNYPLVRERPNPFLQVPGMGEISLLPGVWRAMHKNNPMSFRQFEDLLPLEWEHIVREQFELDDIEKRVERINANGGWVHSYQDMKDSDDLVLQGFGRTMLDVSLGAGLNLSGAFLTLLQHYGLYSPVLDLTSELEVAMFFATHELGKVGQRSCYQYVGTNNRQALLYVFRQDKREMLEHRHERALNLLKPLRPVRQSCVICTSSPFALNLPADFLVGVIKMDFDLPTPLKCDAAALFPSAAEDNFLAALKKAIREPTYVTDFAPT